MVCCNTRVENTVGTEDVPYAEKPALIHSAQGNTYFSAFIVHHKHDLRWHFCLISSMTIALPTTFPIGWCMDMSEYMPSKLSPVQTFDWTIEWNCAGINSCCPSNSYSYWTQWKRGCVIVLVLGHRELNTLTILSCQNPFKLKLKYICHIHRHTNTMQYITIQYNTMTHIKLVLSEMISVHVKACSSPHSASYWLMHCQAFVLFVKFTSGKRFI